MNGLAIVKTLISSKEKCVPCEGGVKPLKGPEMSRHLDGLKMWKLISDKKIEREFEFKTFKEALRFVNKIGAVAEEQGHHPDIYLYGWKYIKLTLYTHAIDGLSKDDFIIALIIDEVNKIK